MKRASLAVGLTILLSSTVFAADKPGEKLKNVKSANAAQAKKPATSPRRQEPVVLTGSYVKHEVRRNGVVTDGSTPVFVLDADAIRNSGAGDLREVLIRRGFNR